MAPLFRKRHTEPGARPGTLVLGEDAVPPRMQAIRYGSSLHEVRALGNVEDVRDELSKEGTIWIDVQGLGDEALLRSLGELFGIHLLALEDVVNVPQRPKSEIYPNHHLLITRMARPKEDHDLVVEQVSLFISDRVVLTFQEQHGDVLDPVRKRLASRKGTIRTRGADYLGYAIIDTIIDGYYPLLEHYGEYLETLENEVIENATSNMLGEIHQLKRNLLVMRRGIWPQRDALNSVLREESPFISEAVKPYFRDCYDHCVQVADVLETYRETAGSLLSTYLSAVSNQTNEVMKVLTIMASIFIPLTFLAGIYGMNFREMPELEHPAAYPALLLVMAGLAAMMLWYFKRRGWIGNGREP